jgi:hypothetical protein
MAIERRAGNEAGESKSEIEWFNIALVSRIRRDKRSEAGL